MSEIYLSLIFYLENQIIIKVKIINKETIFLPAINVKKYYRADKDVQYR
ncbi:hypothetical protein PROSTU_03631 [Providencia stuartii ATCC 25827]|uniref:Uncharacterized protein n=1 Tax=Providencia stuartii ATCC 25827 TaxID=471874 RepID=A0AA86YXJ9_PROST|nr:hypothetical protein PROSTU_03631 [Providencia stuartii ATCC 25827]